MISSSTPQQEGGNPTREQSIMSSKLDDADFKSSETSILDKTVAYCFSQNFIGIFEDYIAEHASEFVDSLTTGEHKLSYTALFNDYLKLFEAHIHHG
jgi:hypothetical protein